MKLFTTPNSKNVIANLRIVTTEKSEFTFLLILYFYDIIDFKGETVNINRFIMMNSNGLKVIVICIYMVSFYPVNGLLRFGF